MSSIKVMVAFGQQTFDLLDSEAKERGVTVQELLRQLNFLLREHTGLHPDPVTTLNPIHNRIPHLASRNVSSEFITHGRHPFLHTRNMLILQLHPWNIQHLPENTEI